ncbi:MAG: hypothetical protein K0S04_4265 [Herbinix sp.]|jgi:hypothetical protein|nr:hypothetical protein [Herbinix sp.]
MKSRIHIYCRKKQAPRYKVVTGHLLLYNYELLRVIKNGVFYKTKVVIP